MSDETTNTTNDAVPNDDAEDKGTKAVDKPIIVKVRRYVEDTHGSQKSGKVIKDATITLMDSSSNMLDSLVEDNNNSQYTTTGAFPAGTYQLKVEKPGYTTKIAHINHPGNPQYVQLNVDPSQMGANAELDAEYIQTLLSACLGSLNDWLIEPGPDSPDNSLGLLATKRYIFKLMVQGLILEDDFIIDQILQIPGGDAAARRQELEDRLKRIPMPFASGRRMLCTQCRTQYYANGNYTQFVACINEPCT